MKKYKEEDIQQQADEYTSSINDPEIPNTDGIDLNSLRITSQRTRAQITSLENQLSKLEKTNKKLGNDLLNIDLKLQNSEKEKIQLSNQIEEIEKKIKEITDSRKQILDEFSQRKNQFEEQKTELQSKINHLKDENSSLEHELSKQKSRLVNLQNAISTKNNEISLLENEISKYNSFPIESKPNLNSEPKIEILEDEISRLIKQLADIQRKNQELETFFNDLKNRLQTEIKNTINHKQEIETQLNSEKNLRKQFNSELESTRQLSISARESVERQWKRKIEEQRSKHQTNIVQIQQSYSNSSNGSSNSTQQLIQTLQSIENIRSENTALEIQLQNQNSNENRYQISIGINERSSSRKMVTLTSLLPTSLDEHSIIYKSVKMIDIGFLHFINLLNRYPSIRMIFIIMFTIANLFWIMNLFS